MCIFLWLQPLFCYEFGCLKRYIYTLNLTLLISYEKQDYIDNNCDFPRNTALDANSMGVFTQAEAEFAHC